MAGADLLSDQGFRIDGRRPGELRRVQCKMGVFSQADGSSYLEQGNTKVLAAIYGPHESRSNKTKSAHDRAVLNCQFSMATFSTGERKRRPHGDRKSLEISMHLKQTFEAAILTELYPRSQIDIYVEVLQADGGNLCACINAATLALMDAGIAMRDYVSACTASMLEDEHPILDMSHIEETSGMVAVMSMAVLPKSGQIVYLEMNNRLHKDHLDKVHEVAYKGCKDIHTVMDGVVRKHVATAAARAGTS